MNTWSPKADGRRECLGLISWIRSSRIDFIDCIVYMSRVCSKICLFFFSSHSILESYTPRKTDNIPHSLSRSQSKNLCMRHSIDIIAAWARAHTKHFPSPSILNYLGVRRACACRRRRLRVRDLHENHRLTPVARIAWLLAPISRPQNERRR